MTSNTFKKCFTMMVVKKGSLMMILKSLKGFINDGAKKVLQ